VIPGGTPASAHLHVCRTVCRRAERRAIAVGEDVNPEVVRYLNRLSDLLFILGRAVNQEPPVRLDSRSEGIESAGAEPPSKSNASQISPKAATSPGTEPLWDPGAHGSNTAPQSA